MALKVSAFLPMEVRCLGPNLRSPNMPKEKKAAPRRRDSAEELLDRLYDDRNRQLRAACRKIIEGASQGLAIYEELQKIDAYARAEGVHVLPHMDFLNFQGLLWMMQLELASLLDDYLRARHERRWLYARLLLLSLYESTKTLRSVFSRGLRKDIVGRLGPESETRVTNLHRYIHHAFEDLEADFGEIRNRLIGHKDPDPIARWRLMSAYSGLELKDFAWEVLEWCAEIAEVDNEYMSAIEILNEDARQRG